MQHKLIGLEIIGGDIFRSHIGGTAVDTPLIFRRRKQMVGKMAGVIGRMLIYLAEIEIFVADRRH